MKRGPRRSFWAAFFPPHRHFGGSPVHQQIETSTLDSPSTLARKPGMF
ncbi:MAG: hypothetical protein HQ464_13860 [Planctomycetes bacterium]|nr:hypothetical protein [Planctomycetota bacterium]